VISGGVLYIGSWDSYFYAIDAASGKEKWRFKTGEDPDIHNQVGIQSSAVVADGMVYFGCRDSNLYALDAATGQKKWAYNNKGSWVIASPLVQKGKIYFATSDSGMFHALDAKTGAELFSLKFSGWPTFASPIIAAEMLYSGSHSGTLFAIDLKEQKTAWEFQTDGAKQNAAKYTKADGTPNYEAAYAGDFYDDMVVGMHKLMTMGSIYASPVLANGVLYIGSTDGALYALN
jgi:outer membrane protein assembly factor BamB